MPVDSTCLESEVIAAYEAFSPELLRFGRAYTHDEDAACEAVQEIFVRFFVERRYGRNIQQPRAWLYQALRNYLLDRLNAEARETAAENLPPVPDSQADPERRVGSRELARQLAAALTPRELDCLRLRAGGFEYHEIASALSIRPGTVAALLSRVASKLRRCAPAKDALALSLTDALRFLSEDHRACSP